MMRARGVAALVVVGICLAAQVAAAQTGSFYRVNLRAADGRFFAAEWGGERELIANRTSAGPWEEFVLQDMTGGELMSGDTVRLRAQNGKYVTSENGTLTATRSAGGQWETFLIFKQNWASGPILSNSSIYLVDYNGWYINVTPGTGAVGHSAFASATTTFPLTLRSRWVTDPSPLDPAWSQAGTPTYSVVNLRSSNGLFYVVENTASEIAATSVSAGQWARFVMIDASGGSLVSGDIVRLRTADGSWVFAQNGNLYGGAAGGKERVFRVYKSNGGTGVINTGELVSLHAFDGRWWVADQGGGGRMYADRSAIGPWEKFTLTRVSTSTSDPSPLNP